MLNTLNLIIVFWLENSLVLRRHTPEYFFRDEEAVQKLYILMHGLIFLMHKGYKIGTKYVNFIVEEKLILFVQDGTSFPQIRQESKKSKQKEGTIRSDVKAAIKAAEC